MQQAIDMLNKVSDARSTRETETHDSLSWITSLFLLEMGVITLLGVCLMQSGSQPLDFTLQLLTLIALVSSESLLADLALPFHGIVQVDVSIFKRIRKSISAVLVAAVEDAVEDADPKSTSSSNWCHSERERARNGGLRRFTFDKADQHRASGASLGSDELRRSAIYRQATGFEPRPSARASKGSVKGSGGRRIQQIQESLSVPGSIAIARKSRLVKARSSSYRCMTIDTSELLGEAHRVVRRASVGARFP